MDQLRVFILGAPRSGTSISFFCMRQVFGLPGRGESHVMPLYFRIYKEFEQYKEKLKNNPNVLVNALGHQEFLDDLSSGLRKFYNKHYPDGSWVDKTPGAENMFAVCLIKEAFPEAKLIATKRTGIEMVQSFQRKFNAPLEAACRSWAAAMRALLWAQENAKDLLVIDQFDMTNSPGEVAHRICTHLGRPEKQEQLSKFFEKTRIEQRSSHDWSKRLTLTEVDWTAEEKNTFVDVCGDMMKRFKFPI